MDEEDKAKMRKYFKKYLHKRNLPIAKLLKTTERVQINQHEMSSKLHKMLDRVELDRPLLFKEKIETLWDDN
jgi:hypothetical protein